MKYIIQRAVAVIREKYGEPLTLDELARTVMVSKFHFLRSFRSTTGVTPGRFLSAVRLAEAKQLLLGTSLKVSDIAAQVGYVSIGSFTRRFTESVGLSPTQYRQSARHREGVSVPMPAAGRARGTIAGTVRPWPVARAGVFVGVFDSPILQGRPVASALLDAPGQFRLTGIHSGTWYVHAATLPEWSLPGRHHRAWGAPSQLVDCTGPLVVREAGPGAAERPEHTFLTPRPAEWFRPPVLLALPRQQPRPAERDLPAARFRARSATAV